MDGFEYVFVEKDGCSVGHEPAEDVKHDDKRGFGGRCGQGWRRELGSSLVSSICVCGGFHGG